MRNKCLPAREAGPDQPLCSLTKDDPVQQIDVILDKASPPPSSLRACRPQDHGTMLLLHPFHSTIRSNKLAANLDRTVPVLNVGWMGHQIGLC